jgi:hypothetical protein
MKMAHFAEIDSKNIVLRVLVVPDEEEARGAEFLSTDLGLGGNWIQTSFTAKIRGKFASVGDKYDAKNDEFIHVATDDEIEIKKAMDEKTQQRKNAAEKLAALGLTAEDLKALDL